MFFFLKKFCKPLRTFLESDNVIQLVVLQEKIFKGFLLWLPCHSELFTEHIYLKEFERGPPKEHSSEIW